MVFLRFGPRDCVGFVVFCPGREDEFLLLDDEVEFFFLRWFPRGLAAELLEFRPALPPRLRPVFFGMKTSSNPGTDWIWSGVPIIFSIAETISPSSSVMKV